jgi:predicted aspartyl protease
LAASLALITLAVATFLTSSPKDERFDKVGNEHIVENHPQLRDETTYEENGLPDRSLNASQQRPKSKRRRLDAEQSGPASSRASSPTDKEGTGAVKENEKGQLTAMQWFEKGESLDDDSDAEVECYLKASELDPGFAPAAFRLGAIYYRQANYDLADQQFASFLKNASNEDKQNFDIYEYYSLADVERLSEAIDTQLAEEAEKQGTSLEQQKQTGLEATSEESEKPATETESEEAGRETNEEVLTVVKFSQVNGQIVVPVVLNDSRRAKVLVDTGAGITVLSTALADEIGLLAEAERPVILKTMAMDVHAQLARLDSIQVGNFNRFDFPVAIADLPLGEQGKFQGILGMDFMNHYTIHIDNEKGTLALSPKTR